MQPREAPPSSKLSQDPPSGARRRGTGRGCCAHPHVHLTPSGAWVYPSQHPDCCLPLTEGQQVQQVTEHDLDFAPGPELDQIPKSRRLFCLSIIPAQTGLESSSQADRAPVTRDKSKFHPCAVPDPREPQCHLQPRGRRDRGGFSSSLWLEKSCGRSQSSAGRWNCKSQPRQGGTAKVAKRNGKIPPRFLQIPVEEEAKCHRDPAGEQQARLGAISSVLPPCAQQPLCQGHI